MKNKKIVIITIIMLIFVIILTGCVQRSTHMVTMRDGINLATDVYLPSKNPNPHGVIFMRTPYNKNPLNLFARAIAQTGWPIIIQDMRGRHASEGEDEVFRTCHTDGPDTLAWIVNQTWSNGKVATWGPSAAGNTQYYIAGANPPELACQFIQVATPNLHKHGIYQGGQFRYNLIYKWLKNQGSLHVLPELYANENYSLEVWTNVSLEDNWQDVNVPAIHIGGWYDCFCQGTVDGFMGYQYQGGPGAQGKSKLIMGPWTHGGAGSVQQGELIYPDYVMGDVTDINASGNEWRAGDDWPPTHTDTNWYLHENGGLSTDYPSNYEILSYTYDPTNPVPTVGGQNLNLPPGPYDQTSVETRDDVLVFTSDVLTEPYEATGAIKARLYVSSDCPDTDFTVKLTDVYPDGRSMLITDGILRMRNREGADHWEFMELGEIYEVGIDLWSTSYIWNTSHRIRIAISSSNYPRFLANPNTIDSMAQNSTYNIAQNTVYLDSDHPSCIILPQITKQELNTQTNDIQYNDNSGFFNIFQNSKLEKLIQKSFNSLTNNVLEKLVPFD
jgi:predicted acyl esterase